MLTFLAGQRLAWMLSKGVVRSFTSNPVELVGSLAAKLDTPMISPTSIDLGTLRLNLYKK